jgi:MFS family permease
MASESYTISTVRDAQASASRGTDRVLDYGMLLATSILIAGLFSDGWAHEHHLVDTFFTPWHGVLYMGFLLSALWPLVATVYARREAGSWRAAIPTGYEFAIFGGPLFIIGGAFDELWHRIVGFEVDVETLLSPSHLFLLGVGLLILSAPARARLLRQTRAQDWTDTVPAWVSLGYVFAVIAFFTAYIQPFEHARVGASEDVMVALGVGGILFQSALMVGFLLFALRSWGLPLGSVTLLLTLGAGLLTLIHTDWRLLLVAVIGGLIGDGLRALLRPTRDRPNQTRLFAALAPMALYGVYFGAIGLTTGIAWSTSLWLGAIILAGAIGFLVSFAFIEPVAPPATVPQR